VKAWPAQIGIDEEHFFPQLCERHIKLRPQWFYLRHLWRLSPAKSRKDVLRWKATEVRNSETPRLGMFCPLPSIRVQEERCCAAILSLARWLRVHTAHAISLVEDSIAGTDASAGNCRSAHFPSGLKRIVEMLPAKTLRQFETQPQQKRQRQISGIRGLIGFWKGMRDQYRMFVASCCGNTGLFSF